MTDCDTLRFQAARCRRLAQSIGDKLTEERLLAMALEYERAAVEPHQERRPTEGRSFVREPA